MLPVTVRAGSTTYRRFMVSREERRRREAAKLLAARTEPDSVERKSLSRDRIALARSKRLTGAIGLPKAMRVPSRMLLSATADHV